MKRKHLEQLRAATGEAEKILILPHNDPDPDAIASAVALGFLLGEIRQVGVDIAYRGIIGRAENKALVSYLGYPLRRLRRADFEQQVPIALVDSQPEAGNNAMPGNRTAAIVIDHHPRLESTGSARFVDVRPNLGATATILTEYLRGARVEPRPELATALFYGIKTDTWGLSRHVKPADVAAYAYLQPRIDADALIEIERAQVSADYFKSFDMALQGARVYNDEVVISNMGQMKYADLAAEMADLLLRLEHARWVICIGEYRGYLVVSVRTRNRQGGAGRFVQSIVSGDGTAGGHGTMAGAQIPLRGRDSQTLGQEISNRALKLLNVTPVIGGRPLI
jgi:nanoRNase/pAp phosphatase (c-di-AMP/oligoRNAs hydrolase)